MLHVLRGGLLIALLAISLSAGAVSLSNDRQGQVLIYPYYTVRNDMATLFSVINTSDKVKAVNVRFTEGKGGLSVLDFNLYLAPKDVWTAAVVDDGDTARIFTNDTSCTVPQIADEGVYFRHFAYLDDLYQDESVDRAREGMLTLIEMGTVDSGDDALGRHALPDQQNCQSLIEAWSPGGVWRDGNPHTDIGAPEGGLVGSQTFIHVVGGFATSIDATALKRFRDEPLHVSPGDVLDLSAVQPAVSHVLHNGNVIESTWSEHPVQAVSAVLAAYRLINEFTFDQVTAAETEWVFAQPTRAQHVSPFGDPTIAPFGDELADEAGQCQRTVRGVYDRDSRRYSDICFNKSNGGSAYKTSPCPPVRGICWATTTSGRVQGDDTVLLGSRLFFTGFGHPLPWPEEVESGWGELLFVQDHQVMVSDEGHAHYGIPSLAISMTVYHNGVINEALSDYGSSDPHSVEQLIELSAEN